jgi:glutamyl-Q tRNA(Asp) synthetase
MQKQAPAHMHAAQSAMKSEANGFAIQGHDQDDCIVLWQDRRLSEQQNNVSKEVGDFVLRRADGLWAYQLAVVVDDAAQGITHIVRGEDLADNTARQMLLQRALNCPTPCYLHTPLVFATDGHKLSKQNGAQALRLENEQQAIAALEQAASVLGLTSSAKEKMNVPEQLRTYVAQWRSKWLESQPR